jgi:hypothetical protein
MNRRRNGLCETDDYQAMKTTAPSRTDQALHAFDTFLAEWTAPAMHDYMFGHATNAADAVRYAIRGITDQRALSLREGPLGYAVFREDAVRPSRDYQKGIVYTLVSPVFEGAAQASNSLDGFHTRRDGYFVLGEIHRYPKLT